MPDHESTALLSRQTKRRRVDIGVKRTLGTATLDFTRAKASIFSAMNPHGPEQEVECSVVQHADGEKSNVLRKLLKRANSYEDTMIPFPGATIISQLLKSNMAKNGGSEAGFPGSGLSSAGSEIHQEDACSNSSRESPRECLSPFGRPSVSQFDAERLSDEHLRAKRARVENIIRGMSHSPSVAARGAGGPEGDRDGPPQQLPPSPRESYYRENKRKQRLPQQQQQSFQQLVVTARKEQKHEERRQLKLQLEDMQKQLRQLQEKFYQVYDSTDSENDEDGDLSEDSLRSDGADRRRPRDPSAADRDRSDNEMSDLDPGRFLDRARALLREQALMAEGGGGQAQARGPPCKGPGSAPLHACGGKAAGRNPEAGAQHSHVASGGHCGQGVRQAPPHARPLRSSHPSRCPRTALLSMVGTTPTSTPPTSGCSASATSSFPARWTPSAACRSPAPTTRQKLCPWWSEKTRITSPPPCPPTGATTTTTTTPPCTHLRCLPQSASALPLFDTPSPSRSWATPFRAH
ncbi:hypothetical protein SKAU_G00195010 [Synaphobranchus kaupii]|uniref:Prospero homeobox protein 1 n=1 Tax=Synaphobranchus kaupii TaxID=118154 RepID=A0A9Q1IVK3_SYNKA|nr:hypothetical protein SKAU_G00195010 [Synaphobranchus kaupii]